MKNMKKIPLLAAIISMMGLCGCGKQEPEPVEEPVKTVETLTGITRFSLSYTSGDYAFSGYDYKAELEDGTVTVTIRPDGIEDPVSMETGTEFMDRIAEIANEYSLSSWDGFNESNQDVLDGNSFYLSLKTDSGQSVSASGYMSYPENYKEAKEKIKALFDEIYQQNYPDSTESTESA